MKNIVDYSTQIYVEIKYTQKLSHVTVLDISTGVLILWELAHSRLLSVTNCLCVIKYSNIYILCLVLTSQLASN